MMKRFIEVKFDLAAQSSYQADPWGRIDYALYAMADQIETALSEGYKIPADWCPPVISLTLEEPEEVKLDALKKRYKNLRDQIRRKERTEL